MLILTAILVLFAGCFYGVREGMIMIRPADNRYKAFGYVVGIRGHVWFKYYHFRLLGIPIGIPTISRGLPMLIMYCLTRLDWTASTVLILSGTLMLGWQCLEWFYSWTRYAVWLPESENFLGHWRTYTPELVVGIRIGLAIGFWLMALCI